MPFFISFNEKLRWGRKKPTNKRANTNSDGILIVSLEQFARITGLALQPTYVPICIYIELQSYSSKMKVDFMLLKDCYELPLHVRQEDVF